MWDLSQEESVADLELQLCPFWCVGRAVPGYSFPV